MMVEESDPIPAHLTLTPRQLRTGWTLRVDATGNIYQTPPRGCVFQLCETRRGVGVHLRRLPRGA